MPYTDEFETTWTIGELIEALQNFPPNTPVWTEGCDCYGTVSGLDMTPGSPDWLLIKRNHD